jgi:hypothetical protein
MVIYHPEMNDPRPLGQLEARLSHNGRHYFVDSPVELSDRGIACLGTLTADQTAPLRRRFPVS